MAHFVMISMADNADGTVLNIWDMEGPSIAEAEFVEYEPYNEYVWGTYPLENLASAIAEAVYALPADEQVIVPCAHCRAYAVLPPRVDTVICPWCLESVP